MPHQVRSRDLIVHDVRHIAAGRDLVLLGQVVMGVLELYSKASGEIGWWLQELFLLSCFLLDFPLIMYYQCNFGHKLWFRADKCNHTKDMPMWNWDVGIITCKYHIRVQLALRLDNIIFNFRLVNYFLLCLNKGHAISYCMTGLKTAGNVNCPGLSGKSCLTPRNNSPFVNCQYNLMSFLCLLSVYRMHSRMCQWWYM